MIQYEIKLIALPEMLLSSYKSCESCCHETANTTLANRECHQTTGCL